MDNPKTETCSVSDLLKFFCVFFMVFNHCILWFLWFSGPLNDSNFFYSAFKKFLFLGWFSYSIPAIAGFSLRDYFQNYWRDNSFSSLPMGKITGASAVICLLGFFTNYMIYNWNAAFMWDVLQFLAFSFVTIAFLTKVTPSYYIYLIGLLVLFSTEWLRCALPIQSQNYFVIMLIGDPNGNNFWPLFPWFSIVVFGFWLGDCYLKYSSRQTNLLFAYVAIIFMAVAWYRDELVPGLTESFSFGAALFQAPVGMVFAVMGFFCFLALCSLFLSQRLKVKKYGLIKSFSKGILWIYILQMIIGDKLSAFLIYTFPKANPIFMFFSFFFFMIGLCWAIGAAYSYFFLQKRIHIVLERAR